LSHAHEWVHLVYFHRVDELLFYAFIFKIAHLKITDEILASKDHCEEYGTLAEYLEGLKVAREEEDRKDKLYRQAEVEKKRKEEKAREFEVRMC